MVGQSVVLIETALWVRLCVSRMVPCSRCRGPSPGLLNVLRAGHSPEHVYPCRLWPARGQVSIDCTDLIITICISQTLTSEILAHIHPNWVTAASINCLNGHHLATIAQALSRWPYVQPGMTLRQVMGVASAAVSEPRATPGPRPKHHYHVATTN